MNRITLHRAVVALLCTWATDAIAACDFDVAWRAKGVRGSMVRAYAACPGTVHPAANTQTEGGTEACTPVSPAEVNGDATPYGFGQNGACAVQFLAKHVPSCAALVDENGTNLGLESGACHVTYVKARCEHLRGPGGPIGAADDGFTLATISRATLADDSGGDMTVVDFPVTFDFDEPRGGSMELYGNSAEALIPLVGVANADLPECTSIELLSVTIKDPDNRPFATLGGSTAP